MVCEVRAHLQVPMFLKKILCICLYVVDVFIDTHVYACLQYTCQHRHQDVSYATAIMHMPLYMLHVYMYLHMSNVYVGFIV